MSEHSEAAPIAAPVEPDSPFPGDDAVATDSDALAENTDDTPNDADGDQEGIAQEPVSEDEALALLAEDEEGGS